MASLHSQKVLKNSKWIRVLVSDVRHERKNKRLGDYEKHMHSQEEREMRNLENSLFGSLYFSVDFGKDEEKKGNIWVKKCSTLFITYQSPYIVSCLLMKMMMTSKFQGDIMVDENETKRQPTWVDEEDERTTIDGKRNPKIQSIFFDDYPVKKASFLPDGFQVIVSGRRKLFYSIDLVKAKADKLGALVPIEEKNLEMWSHLIGIFEDEGTYGVLKMNGTVCSLAFADEGHQSSSFGDDGHIYHWDLRTRACFHKGVDKGCINGTTLCCPPQGNLFVVGSASGIVNVCNREELSDGKKKLLKNPENLITKVDSMTFNHDAQVLDISHMFKH
ncbi:hypothetical protein Cgig2_017585 [Carnegiea gigantea]|uniref:Uncharacterized protein n=1 Tax=Carnegiea gigantea TaxID=171969 RepID=A0A9Q1QKI4_9CARY|nr:hypothetical protein Cgig2_017585 [Carnegiea gigantea]